MFAENVTLDGLLALLFIQEVDIFSDDICMRDVSFRKTWCQESAESAAKFATSDAKYRSVSGFSADICLLQGLVHRQLRINIFFSDVRVA